jgi:type II secretory pathway pseudopilin PulG
MLPFPATNRIHTRPTAFTLVELLLAISVASLLIVVLTNITSKTLQISSQTRESMQAINAASSALDLIASDLQSMAVTTQPYEYLVAQPEVDDIAGTKPMRLAFNAFSPIDAGIPFGTVYPNQGQALALSYRVYQQDPLNPAHGNNKVLGLYRTTATDSNEAGAAAAYAFKHFLGQKDLASGWNSFWQSAPSVNDLIITNVVDFQVTFYLNATGTASLNATNLSREAVRLAGNGYSVGDSDAAKVVGSPSIAEISITILRESAVPLWGNGKGAGALSPDALKKKYGQTLVRRVSLVSPHP